MKITICGSTAFIDEIETVSKELAALGHEVKFPPVKVIDKDGNELHTRDYYKMKKAASFTDPEFWNNHTHRIRDHFSKVVWSEAILVTNYDKNNIENYIGPNTFLEMGIAFHHGKKIFLLNPIPEVAYKEEILGMRPIILKGDFSLLC